jgi:REP element-mobilizing transposase RayT
MANNTNKNQLELLPKNEMRYFKVYTHGGTSLKKRRKVKRPLVPGLVTHVVFKSSKAKGKLSFYHHKKLVQRLLEERAKRFFVHIQDVVNMGNHLHLKVRFKDVTRFQNFLKTFSALLARRITGAHRGAKFGKFWDGLVYTRVLRSKFEELGLRGYFEGNHIQRELGYEAREAYLARFNRYLYRLKSTRASPQTKADRVLLGV